MNRIEKGLHEHHARLAEQAQNNPSATAQAPGSSTSAALEAPFAKVNSVVPGSPADSAGLRAGDNITKFGWVDWTNHEKLGRVAEAVSQNEGVSCPTVPLSHVTFLHGSFLGISMQEIPLLGRFPACAVLTEPQLPIIVKALRNSTSGGPAESISMQLTPRRNWGGRGLLGCHLLPL